ncbi:GT2 family glycosyltransferase [Muricomes intestini]|uniref:GT2 family glycosyltransferase n=1 Tax=Muricomes intestini TaxID=1796634 RepID=A0A4R3K2I9_9FIRM|nr:glycosyltransferase [Muricomes intestini]TCS76628.1 GT2 family glycosyltransferase [Muricomes intestini]
MKKIGVVVVTFNRLECLKENIRALTHLQIPKNTEILFFIINNASTDGTTEWLMSLGDKRLRIITLGENTGGSGGFYTGVKACTEAGMDYIWGMDDDAYPQQNALVNIYEQLNCLGEEACYWSNCNQDNEFSEPCKKVDSWMFVGFFIPVAIVKKIGFPRNDFFIFYDDLEYSDRIQKYGYSIYKVRDSVIIHKDAYFYKYKGYIGSRQIELPKFSDWKMYYYIRNKLLRYSKTEGQFWENVFVNIPKMILKVMVLNPKQTKIVFRAFWHGLIRKKGKVVSP